MNFFEHQEIARKKSFLLGLLFVLALILIATSINLISYLILHQSNIVATPLTAWLKSRESITIFGVVVLVIAGGTIYQFINLAKGGEAVANMAKGRPINLDASSPHEQRLINLVEEMSIASGTPMPDLFVMDNEPSINAFVAGYEPTETVLVVTRGALENLSREELQGVIGHEFSHILNGDMRINVRLIAILAGILSIGQIGQFLLRLTMNRSHFSSSKKNEGNILFFIAGLAMVCIGYIGLFFGRIIKAAISRQREYLADAASIQFTRNPEGIAAALYKIHDSQNGSRLAATYHAEDINHLCFSEAIKMNFSGLLASHPPLPDRINAINTSYLARFRARSNISKRQTSAKANSAQTKSEAGHALQSEGISSFYQPSSDQSSKTPSSLEVVQSAGAVSPPHYDYALALLASIPDQIKQLAHTPSGAKILLLSLMLKESADNLHTKAIASLSECNQSLLNNSKDTATAAHLSSITIKQRLPILEIALAALRQLDQTHKNDFIQDLANLARIDAKLTFFEFSLLTLAKQQLSPQHGKKLKTKYHSTNEVSDEIALILKMFAKAATSDLQEQQRLFSLAIQPFTIKIEWNNTFNVTEERISHSLNKLRLLSPLLKRPLLLSCAECVLADNSVHLKEYELLRLVSVVLDCPIPPLLITQQ